RRGRRRDSVRAALSERTPAPARAVRAKAWPTGYIAPRFVPVFPLRPYAGLSPLVTVSARTHLNSVPATSGRWAHPFRRPSVAAPCRAADQTARVRSFPTPRREAFGFSLRAVARARALLVSARRVSRQPLPILMGRWPRLTRTEGS